MPARRRSRSQPPADLSRVTPPPSVPPFSRVLRADLRCYLCTVTLGALEADAGAALPPVTRFCPADGSPGRMVAWRGLRCPRCHSSLLVVEDLETVLRDVEFVDWAADQPRRGRPPLWLVALRKPQGAA